MLYLLLNFETMKYRSRHKQEIKSSSTVAGSTEEFRQNAAIYKIMANPKRLQILNVLATDHRTFSDLVEIMKLPKANVAQHLSVLKHAGLIKECTSGRACYRITDRRVVKPCFLLSRLRQEKKINL